MFTVKPGVYLASMAALSVLVAGSLLFAQQPLPARDRAEHQADGKEQDRLDRHGDPLPSGAIARLGTVRLRREFQSSRNLAFLPDDKALVSARTLKVVQFWDAKTGKPLHKLR